MNKLPMNNPITAITTQGITGLLTDVLYDPEVNITYPINVVKELIASYPKTVKTAPMPPTTANLTGFLMISPKTSKAAGQKSIPLSAMTV